MSTERPLAGQGDSGRGSEQPLSADTPIEKAEEDRLQRAPFARALAEDVRQSPRESGFVVGLTGRWGEGKTSVLRLIEEELSNEDATAVVRFNPWLFSGTEQLVEHFFVELSSQLSAGGSPGLLRIAKALRGYGRLVSPLRYLPYVGGVARVTAEAAGLTGEALAGEGPLPSTREQAAELRAELETLDKPIVTMVDDIDRLRDEEIVDVMRLVRVVGDFPNLVYVLAFDRPVVERALGSGDRPKGRAYLDKIVHLSHELPRIRPEDLTALVQEAIGLAVGDPSACYLDRDRLATVFWGGMRSLFSTVRDVRRYGNVLPGALRQLGDEVALSDVMALEAIRLFEPECFEGIVESRDALTTPAERHVLGSAGSDELEAAVRAIPSRATNKAAIEDLIGRLFPMAEGYLGGGTYSESFLGEWQRERRVACAAVLATYLHKRLPPGALPAREIERVAAAIDAGEGLDELLGGLDDGELESLLARLAERDLRVSAERVGAAVGAILRQRPRLQREGASFADFGADLVASRVIYRMLRNLGPEQVAGAIEQLDFPDLSGRHDVLRIVGFGESRGHELVDREHAVRLEQQLADAVLAADAADLAQEWGLASLIALLERARGAELRERLAEWIDDDRFLACLIDSFKWTSLASTVGEAAVQRTVQLNWPALARLVDVDALRERLRAIDPAWVDRELGDDTLVLWRQALRYVDDPEAAKTEVQQFRGGEEEERRVVEPLGSEA